jgi:predicted nucleic acid-binding Zn ribbon protein
MPNKKTNSTKQEISSKNQEKRRLRMMQIVFAVFSILLILSMVLSLTTSF